MVSFPFNNTLIFHHEMNLPLHNHSLLLCSDFSLYLFIFLGKDVSKENYLSLPEGKKAVYSEINKSFSTHLIDETSCYISWVIADIVNSYTSCSFLPLSTLLHPLAWLLNAFLLSKLLLCFSFDICISQLFQGSSILLAFPTFSRTSQFSFNSDICWNASTLSYLSNLVYLTCTSRAASNMKSTHHGGIQVSWTWKSQATKRACATFFMNP